MSRVLPRCGWLFICLCTSSPMRADVQTLKGDAAPGRILPAIMILSPDWIGKTPPSTRINAPEFLGFLYPGQRIALAIKAEGGDRDKLLRGAGMSVRISTPGQPLFEERDLKPQAVRKVKAEGADFALMILDAGGMAKKDRASLEGAMARVSFAVFQPDWEVPLLDQAQDVQISATLSGTGQASHLESATIRIRPTADWLRETPDGIADLGRFLNRYHEDLPPGRLLSLLKGAAANGGLSSAPVLSFFATAFRDVGPARSSAIAAFPSLDSRTQFAMAVTFRFGGQDISGFLPLLSLTQPGGALKALDEIQAFKDPRESVAPREPITAGSAQEIGTTMDECWGAWMATGDQSYLRALVGLLEGASDYPALLAWKNARGGVKGLNLHVARGLAYQVAGWSIGAFQRTDPLVSDWLIYWKDDPAFPLELRKELDSLPSSPAFRRNN